MGKFYMTNEKEWDTLLHSCFAESGWNESAQFETGSCFVTLYAKRSLSNENAVSMEDDFTACAGTLFYKGLFSRDALAQLAKDARNHSVTELRKNMNGSYVAIVKCGDIIRVFVDETCTYHIYYAFRDNRYLLSNTYYHVEKSVRGGVNGTALWDKGIRGGLSGKETPYEGIFLLGAEEYLEIDAKSNAFCVKPCALNDYSRTFESREDALDNIWKAADKICALRSQYLKKQILFLTGGVDSRVQLAMSLAHHEKPLLAYWTGGDVITNGSKQDLEINREIAEKYGLESVCYDVTQDFSETMRSLNLSFSDRYGEYASKYAGNRKWFYIFENLKGFDYIDTGAFGEALRPLGELEQAYSKSMTLEKFVEDVYCRTQVQNALRLPKAVYDAIASQIRRYYPCPQSNGNFSQDDYFRIFNCSRFSSDTVIRNLYNMYAYSFAVLTEKQVADLTFSIPYDWLSGDWLAIALTEKWEPTLLDVPYYTVSDKRSVPTPAQVNVS